MESQETKRKEYEEIIKDIPLDKLVYIDESGIEAGITADRGWCLKGRKLSAKRSGKYYQRRAAHQGWW